MLRGSVLARSLLGKTIHLRFGMVVQKWLRGPFGLDGGGRQGHLGDFGLIGMAAGGAEAAWGLVGVVAGVVEAALDGAAPSWFAGVKQNSSEAKPLSCEHLVGVTRFELVTSSVSGKRSPPELNARSRVRECAGNNITELPPSGKNYFLKSGDLRPYPPRCSANSTRKVAFVPPMNCTFA